MSEDPSTSPRIALSPNLYCLSLGLQGIRCFGSEKQTLNLATQDGRPARWTTILGENGTGKSTLLQAIALFTKAKDQTKNWSWPDFTRSTGPFFEGSPESYWRVNPIEVQFVIADSLDQRPGERRSAKFGFYRRDFHEPGDFGNFTFNCFGYGAGRRGTSTSSITATESSDGVESLFNDDADLTNPGEWLLRLDYSTRRSESGDAELKLRRVIKALCSLLPDVSDVRFEDSDRGSLVPTVEFQTSDGWVEMRQLGHGYRGLISWTVDLAARMFGTYPASPNPLQEPAVVLVDEIDLHLHPRWQRTLVKQLTSLFTRTQFIVTAHSPLIVQGALEDSNIAVLRRQGDAVTISSAHNAVQKWRIDQILSSDLFEVPARGPELDDRLSRRVQLLSQASLSFEDQQEVQRLDEEIGTLPTGETPEDASRLIRLVEETNSLIKKYGMATP